MIPARRKLYCPKGKTFTDLCSLQTGPDCENLDPWDLAGCTARLQIRSKVDNSVLISLTTENGRIVLNDPTGYININIPAVTTADFPLGYYKYELEVETADEFVFSPFFGTFQVTDEVTV